MTIHDCHYRHAGERYLPGVESPVLFWVERCHTCNRIRFIQAHHRNAPIPPPH